METRKLTTEDMEKVKKFLPFTMDYVDDYTPEALQGLPVECSFQLRPMTVAERKRWIASAKKIAEVDRMNRLALSKAIEEGKTEYQKATAELAEGEMYAILEGCVQKVNFWEVTADDVKPFSGGVKDLPEWLVIDLSNRLSQISSLTTEEVRGFGF